MGVEDRTFEQPMTFRYLIHLCFCTAIALTGAVSSHAQPEDPGSAVADTARADTSGQAVVVGADSLRVSTGGGAEDDTVVNYSARDSMKLSVSRKLMRLYGEAEVTKGAMRLTAGYIEIDFRKSELFARAVYDSATKQYTGVPVFEDATQEFSALSMRYNFKTGKGITEAAETRFDDGFYFGEKIKRVDENTYFIKNGVYTTCDAPHPHYFFRAEKMKLAVDDKFYLDQPTLHVADVPIFFVPIGLFFARSGGKQSGLILPTWGQTSQRGFAIERLGYFWAGNDYVDATVLGTYYSKGGYTLTLEGRARHREWNIDQADVRYTLGRTRDDPDEPLATAQRLEYSHQQRLGRRSQFGGNLDFSTQNAIRQTNLSGERVNRSDDITTQLLISNLSFNTGFDWGSFSTSYSRTHDVITNELTQVAPVRISVPAWTPFASGGVDPGVFDNLSLSYSGVATWEEVRADTLPGGGFRINDTRRGIQHSPSINLTLPRIGYFNFTPSVSAQGSTFFRRTIKEYVDDSTIVTRTEPEITQTFTYSAGLDVTTTLYGIVQPRILGLNALRHVIQPTLSFRYRPDFGLPKYGYFDSVRHPRTGVATAYSVFEADRSVAPAPGAGLENSVSLSVRNTFEAKIAQGDTVEDRRVQLLSLGGSVSYNAAAPEFKWSTIALTAATDLGTVGTLSANLTLDPYADTNGFRVPQLLSEIGGGLVRVTQGGVRFDVSFSDQGFGSTLAPVPPSDSVSSRRQRFDFEPIPFEEEQFFGDEVRGAGDFRIPWTITLGGTYNASHYSGTELSEQAGLTLSFNLGLTPTLRVSSSLSYDLITKEIGIPRILFQKDLHCWEMEFDWRPSGYATGFYFRLGIKAPQLRDIELERERTFFE